MASNSLLEIIEEAHKILHGQSFHFKRSKSQILEMSLIILDETESFDDKYFDDQSHILNSTRMPEAESVSFDQFMDRDVMKHYNKFLLKEPEYIYISDEDEIDHLLSTQHEKKVVCKNEKIKVLQVIMDLTEESFETCQLVNFFFFKLSICFFIYVFKA